MGHCFACPGNVGTQLQEDSGRLRRRCRIHGPDDWHRAGAQGGVTVVVLEAQEAGFGGSGRNAGHSTPTFTYFSLPELRKILGEPWAERLIHRQSRANDRVSGLVERYQIQCEWRQNGYLQAAHRPGAIGALQRKADDYNAIGAKTRFIDRYEAEALTGSPRFH